MWKILFLLLPAVLLIGSCDEDSPNGLAPGPNIPPEVVIQSPPESGGSPTEILLTPSLTFTVADRDGPESAASLRWTFVSTAPFGDDWSATEDALRADPNGFIWTSWIDYAAGDSGMMVGDTVSADSYVLAAQARDVANGVSVLDDGSLRRVIATNDINNAPSVTILSPVRSFPDPLLIDIQPTITFVVTDVEDSPANLSIRYAFVPTADYEQDWDSTESYIAASPGDVSWSEWMAFVTSDSAMSIPVTDPIARRPYVLAVQARDGSGKWSILDDESLRRVQACPLVNDIPTISITVPRRNGLNPAAIPPIATLVFRATDVDNNQRDLSLRWAMVDTRDFDEDWRATEDFILANPDAVVWSEWLPVVPDDGIDMSIVTPPIDLGPYILAAQTRDPCGGVSTLDSATNMRRVRVSQRSTGPVLVARNRFMGSITTAVCNTPVVITDILAGLPIAFQWAADASVYGGTVMGYRYGWDILDLDDDSQWEIEYTPFVGLWAASAPRSFFFGTHTFHVEVIDNSGYCSRATFKINIAQYSGTRNLLLVDDYAVDESVQAGWDNPTGNGVLPSDEEHDQFWLDMLADLEAFNPGTDVIEVSRNSDLPLTILAQYETIIWNVYSEVTQQQNSTLLGRLIEYQPKEPSPPLSAPGYREGNPLAQFMAVGGKILITGRHPVSNAINRNLAGAPVFPFLQLYDHEGRQDEFRTYTGEPLGDESFGYLELCDDVLEFAVANSVRGNEYVCTVEGERNAGVTRLRDTGMREAIPLDAPFPRLHMHDRTAGPGKYYDPAVRGFDAEIYNPQYFFSSCVFAQQFRQCLEPIYGLHCLDNQEPTYNAPVAYWVVPASGGARSAVIGFSLVHFEEAEVKQALDQILYGEWGLPRAP